MNHTNHIYFGHMLRIATSDPETNREYSIFKAEDARKVLQHWVSSTIFYRWAQSLSPEDAAKLFAILHE